MAAWKGTPKYKVQVLDLSTGEQMAVSQTFTATPNANGSSSANVKSAQLRELPFTIAKASNYVISFTNESQSSGLDEFLLLECRVNSVVASGIIATQQLSEGTATTVYDLSGRRVDNVRQGQMVIIRSADGKTRKVLRR
jgi:hypothetical protein